MAARRGFTLIEVLMASSVFLIVIGGVVGLFVGIQRMAKTALAETELALGMREVREKLLFHLSRPEEGRPTTGLLSGDSFDAASCATSDWMNRTISLDWPSVDVSASGSPGYFISLEHTINGVSRRERVVVPRFGKIQQTLKEKVFDD